MKRDEITVFRVSSSSVPTSLAYAMSKALETHSEIVSRAIGVGAVNQAVKAIAIARGHVASSGKDMVIRIGFQNVSGESGDDITALIFRCTTQ